MVKSCTVIYPDQSNMYIYPYPNVMIFNDKYFASCPSRQTSQHPQETLDVANKCFSPEQKSQRRPRGQGGRIHNFPHFGQLEIRRYQAAGRIQLFAGHFKLCKIHDVATCFVPVQGHARSQSSLGSPWQPFVFGPPRHDRTVFFYPP